VIPKSEAKVEFTVKGWVNGMPPEYPTTTQPEAHSALPFARWHDCIPVPG